MAELPSALSPWPGLLESKMRRLKSVWTKREGAVEASLGDVALPPPPTSPSWAVSSWALPRHHGPSDLPPAGGPGYLPTTDGSPAPIGSTRRAHSSPRWHVAGRHGMTPWRAHGGSRAALDGLTAERGRLSVGSLQRTGGPPTYTRVTGGSPRWVHDSQVPSAPPRRHPFDSDRSWGVVLA